MEILGCIVYHKRYGKGVIEKLRKESYGDFILVHFDHTLEGSKSTPFPFPSAFTEGILISHDERISQYIEGTTSERTCSICGKVIAFIQRIENVPVCKECEKNKYQLCQSCKRPKDKRLFRNVLSGDYKSVKICHDCWETQTYQCDNCHRVFADSTQMYRVHKQLLCPVCFDELPKKCYFCGEPLNCESGEIFYTYQNDVEERIYVCSSCIETQTFVCNACGDRRLSSDLVDSKYVPASQRICRYCVTNCARCNEAIDKKHMHITHDYDCEVYCLDCWDKYNSDCSICGNKFVPSHRWKDVCPTCGERRTYVDRLKKLDFSIRSGKHICYNDLRYNDVCKLFTSLHRNCEALDAASTLPKNAKEFHYIVMNFDEYRIIITFLRDSTVGNIPRSVNITMTEFKKRQHYEEVLSELRYWLPKSTETITLSEGKMKVLYSPVLLRVETDDDKDYGKQWCGRGHAIPRGNNWGDTTDFYIIGVLV